MKNHLMIPSSWAKGRGIFPIFIQPIESFTRSLTDAPNFPLVIECTNTVLDILEPLRFVERRKHLQALTEGSLTIRVPTLVENTPVLYETLKLYTEKHSIVGALLYAPDNIYEPGKTSVSFFSLSFTECSREFTIEDFIEGKGLLKNALGSLVCSYLETQIIVGSGLGLALRKELWENKARYLGKTITVGVPYINKDGSLGSPCTFQGFTLDKQDKSSSVG